MPVAKQLQRRVVAFEKQVKSRLMEKDQACALESPSSARRRGANARRRSASSKALKGTELSADKGIIDTIHASIESSILALEMDPLCSAEQINFVRLNLHSLRELAAQLPHVKTDKLEKKLEDQNRSIARIQRREEELQSQKTKILARENYARIRKKDKELDLCIARLESIVASLPPEAQVSQTSSQLFRVRERKGTEENFHGRSLRRLP